MRTLVISGLVLAASMAASAWAALAFRNSAMVWDHFDVVKPGILYRSGELRPEQLAEAVRVYGIKTLVNLQMTPEGVPRERAWAKRLGVDFLHLPMPGDGFGREDQFRAVLEAVDDPARRPVLVHCAEDLRTGAAVALYRFERDGWTLEDVDAEMRRQTYRDGWLPAYVYAMVRDRPFSELFSPWKTFDRNRPAEPPPRPAAAEVAEPWEVESQVEIAAPPELPLPIASEDLPE